MNHVEKKFRENQAKPKKHIKLLTQYIEYLLDHEHIVEASYYLNKLLELKPEHEKALTLGYKIAIRKFDVSQVNYFDKKLQTIKIKDKVLLALQLEYVSSLNNHAAMEECVEQLLGFNSLSESTYQLIIESVTAMANLHLYIKIFNYFQCRKMKPSDSLNDFFKKTALTKFIQVLSKVP